MYALMKTFMHKNYNDLEEVDELTITSSSLNQMSIL